MSDRGSMSGHLSANEIAGRLLAAHDAELSDLVPFLVERVSSEFDLPEPAPERQWPVDLVAAVRELLTCVATNDLDRIGARRGIFEGIGLEWARVGMDFDSLAAAIRLATRVVQARTHRSILSGVKGAHSDAVLELLERVLAAGELVVAAARRGFDVAALADGDEAGLGRRLGSELVGRGERSADLAQRIGWHPEDFVCAVIAMPQEAGRVNRVVPVRLAHFARAEVVVLAVPLAEDRLATTLRPLLEGIDCSVGPAFPLADFHDSLDLCHRLSTLPALRGSGPVFADEHLLELAIRTDPAVGRALRRKYFGELDRLPEDHRSVLVRTLHEWLLQWGHRPRIAAALTVHPQTVSGRMHRLKDLLADDLEDPRVRTELLALLTSEAAAQTS